jgi:hypothetical protein
MQSLIILSHHPDDVGNVLAPFRLAGQSPITLTM